MSSQFYKNVEIADKYGVSHPTIGGWIKDSLAGKNSLILTKNRDKHKIAVNAQNNAILDELSKKAKKYKNTLYTKKVKPLPEFYELFSQDEILEIMADLDLKHRQKCKFTYKRPEFWMSFVDEFKPVNTFVPTDLLKALNDYLNIFLSDSFNLIDLGPADGMPIKSFIEKNYSKIDSYIAIDISQKMLELCKNNITKWFKNLESKYYYSDFEKHNLSSNVLSNRGFDSSIGNLFLCLGGTYSNLDYRIQFLQNIKDSMLENDLLVFTFAIDKLETRADVSGLLDDDGILDDDAWPMRYIGIDLDECKTDAFFNEKKKVKEKILTLDTDYEIEVEIFGKPQKIHAYKSNQINIWKRYLSTFEEIIKEIESAELEAVSLIKDKSQNVGMAFCKLKLD